MDWKEKILNSDAGKLRADAAMRLIKLAEGLKGPSVFSRPRPGQPRPVELEDSSDE